MAKNPKNHQQTKNVDVHYYYIRKKEEDGTIAIKHFPTDQIVVDGFTKSLFLLEQSGFVKRLDLEKKLIFEH